MREKSISGEKLSNNTGDMALKDMEQWELMKNHAIKNLELKMEQASHSQWFSYMALGREIKTVTDRDRPIDGRERERERERE